MPASVKPDRQFSQLGASTSYGLATSQNPSVFKRQICFNCGIAGHIARNCPKSRTLSPEPQRKTSAKKNYFSNSPSRSGSSDNNWNMEKARRQQQLNKNQQAKTHAHMSPKSHVTKKPVQNSNKNSVSKLRVDGPLKVSNKVL